ncbi:MAG: sigma-70 family RNA polymerase sigma factor [Acidobacteriota bacterium]
MTERRQEVTELLLSWNDGHKEALDHLMPIVADELRQLARGYLNDERDSHTLQPTALVNELYLRLVDRRRVTWENRSHFFGFAATTMRRILVDHARAHRTEKRGGGSETLVLDEAMALPDQREIDLVALDDALKDLEKLDPRQGRLVELRFFAGLTIEEASEVLGVGHATVSRDWKTAKAWLHRELRRR